MSIIIRYLVMLLFIGFYPLGLHATPQYEIEEVIGDHEVFIINGNQYTARYFWCPWFYEGDWVIFTHGSPYGFCATAQIVNMRIDEECDLWCD